MAIARRQAKGAAEYGREALKHWGSAARHGFAAIAAARRRSRANGAADSGDEPLAEAELPIQASIDVAVPVSAVFALCTDYGGFPEFLDRVKSVEVDGRSLVVVARVGGAVRELSIDVMDERPDERLDWQCADGFEHSGVISVHPLAPRLTRLELTVERQPEGLGERLGRRLGLTQRTIEEELRRFKAYAELWEEAEEFEDADVRVAGEEPELEAGAETEAPDEDEAGEPVDEAEPVDEQLEGDEEPLEEEEPAESARSPE